MTKLKTLTLVIATICATSLYAQTTLSTDKHSVVSNTGAIVAESLNNKDQQYTDGVYQVKPGIWSVTGLGMDNMNIIEGKTGLIVIDGGKGQLSAALKSLESLGLKLPCISLAKENEEVFVPKSKNPTTIPKHKASLKILQHARDETHRFGVAYNRTIRKNQIK